MRRQYPQPDLCCLNAPPPNPVTVSELISVVSLIRLRDFIECRLASDPPSRTLRILIRSSTDKKTREGGAKVRLE